MIKRLNETDWLCRRLWWLYCRRCFRWREPELAPAPLFRHLPWPFSGTLHSGSVHRPGRPHTGPQIFRTVHFLAYLSIAKNKRNQNLSAVQPLLVGKRKVSWLVAASCEFSLDSIWVNDFRGFVANSFKKSQK